MQSQQEKTGTVPLPYRRFVVSATLGFLVSSAAAFSTAYADDTEVFFGQVDANTNVHPNVLFVLDTSGSMNSGDYGYSGTRLERMKTALNTILDNSANVNVGLMRFNGYYGGGAVIYPITGIDKQICPNNDCGSVVITSQVSAADDDMEQFLYNGQMTPSGSRLSMGNDFDRAADYQPQLVGFRFQNLDIPSGATITSAKLEFTAEATRTGEAELVIQGHDVGDAPTIGTTTNYLSNLPRTSAEVTWQPEDWYIGNVYQSPDVTSIVQELADRSDWCGGQSMGFIVKGNGERGAVAYNKSPNAAPILRITYDSTSIPNSAGCIQKAVLSQIDSSEDDAYEKLSRGKVVSSSNNLSMPMVTESRYNRRTGTRTYIDEELATRLRFRDLAIPQGAEIISASIEFEVDEQRAGDLAIDFAAENVDDAPGLLADNYWISNRPVVASPVTWSISDSENWSVNEKVRTPDLSTHVQAIVDRAGWVQNNDIAFIARLSGSLGNYRTFDSYDGEQPAAAKLRIEYRTQVGGNGQAAVVYNTARDDMKKVVNDLSAVGGTPIVAAYYEAVQYMLGGRVDYGTQRGYYRDRRHRVSHPDTYTGGAVSVDSRCTAANPDSDYCKDEQINGEATYLSPLADSCQTNHIVFLSDGEATSNTAADKVRNLMGATSCSPNDGMEACGRELATWLDETDHNLSMSRTQNISTYTIGFNINSNFLEDLATSGGGSYYDAASAEDLVEVFQNILGDVLAIETSFVAPGATVNQFNRLTHRNDVYFALFRPDRRPTWSGNLKRYHVGANSNDEIVIQDINGRAAIDPNSGFFSDTAKSWWSDTVDGSAVDEGGAASNMSLSGPDGTGSRRIFTYTGDSVPSSGVDLTAVTQNLHESNSLITTEMLGLSGGLTVENIDRRTELLQWARGIDVLDVDMDNDNTDVRSHIGDPMHAQPAILNYQDGGSTKTTIYVATNEGLLHAIEHENGTELYAYMPKELLDNINPYFENQQSTRHPYGLDGDLAVWHDDSNENVTVDAGEKAYLFLGMRRGGDHYYALDVSDRLNPKLLWQIDGGTGDFAQLGQTWSKPVPTTIIMNGVEKRVVIFAGGYDTNQDPDTANLTGIQSTDSIGNAIYIVDAETGERLWVGQGTTGGDQVFADMNYSIPSDIRIIDINADGLADQMYVGDMGGQLWRFDFQPFHQSGQLVYGGVMAKLNGTKAADARRFYNEPDVALISDKGQRFLSVSIGSGWRAHPLNEIVEDRFYMIRSNSVFSRPAGYGKNKGSAASPDWNPIVESDLVNITDDLQPTTNEFGWMLELESLGEKVMGKSITINNQIIFTSYEPAGTGDACSPAVGGGAIYVVDALTGAPTLDLDDSDQSQNPDPSDNSDVSENQANYSTRSLTKTDRKKSLTQDGIPPSPTALITETNGKIGTTVLVSTEQLDVPFDNLTQRTYWQDNGRGSRSPQDIQAENNQP